VKIIKGTESFRSAIGQALIYRMGYRYVIIVWKDLDKKEPYSAAFAQDKEKGFIDELSKMNIFCILK
ncbi:MAG: hypothetical protein D6698_15730, partial [Gammaproteobacteria bacterium]